MDGLEREMGEALRVARVDLHSAAGAALAARWGARLTPTFLFFDAEGREVWRQVGGLDAARVREGTRQP